MLITDYIAQSYSPLQRSAKLMDNPQMDVHEKSNY